MQGIDRHAAVPTAQWSLLNVPPTTLFLLTSMCKPKSPSRASASREDNGTPAAQEQAVWGCTKSVLWSNQWSCLAVHVGSLCVWTTHSGVSGPSWGKGARDTEIFLSRQQAYLNKG